MSSGDLAPYLDLFRSFAAGSLSAAQFETEYLPLFKNDPHHRSAAVFDILNRVFLDVDEYVDDDRLRSEAGGLDAEQLRASVTSALRELSH